MKTTETAIFAAGCFWGVEELFRQLNGVKSTEVGYTGGHVENPTYKEVCQGNTEHAEAVRIVFDCQEINFEALLEQFWGCHDPTQKDRQGLDVGRQYRTAIFFTTSEQQRIAEASKKALKTSYSRPILTEITPASTFYLAEDYHQQYVAKKRGLV